MAGVSSIAILRDIQTLFDHGSASGLTDRQLLDRFMSRAGPKRRLRRLSGGTDRWYCGCAATGLGDHNDVQDAFQATFLVLVRKGRSIRKLDSVGGWLYGVACRVAARARVEAARRRSAEERAALRIVEAVESARGGRSDRRGIRRDRSRRGPPASGEISLRRRALLLARADPRASRGSDSVARWARSAVVWLEHATSCDGD